MLPVNRIPGASLNNVTRFGIEYPNGQSPIIRMARTDPKQSDVKNRYDMFLTSRARRQAPSSSSNRTGGFPDPLAK